MLEQEGFNQWADAYDTSVAHTEARDAYPFAGYEAILEEIARRVMAGGAKTVLDIGFGTGKLTARLYKHGCKIYGQDFSSRMIELAQQEMPQAELYQGDFSRGLVEPLRQQRYDAIIATYSLHHLTDPQKIAFLNALLPLLNAGGSLYIGDVAFATRAALAACRAQAGQEWDDSEIYFVCDELKPYFPNLAFTPMSRCAGILTLKKEG